MSVTERMVPPGGSDQSGSRHGRRRSRAGILLAVLALLLAAVTWASTARLSVYAISPGVAQAVTGPKGLVRVPARLASATRGSILLTDVELAQVTPLQWLADHFRSDVELVPAAAVLGPLPAGQLRQQEQLQMDSSQQAAAVAALADLGYPVVEHRAPIVQGVQAGSPAATLARDGGLSPGDALVAVGGLPTATIGAVRSALSADRPGETVSLTLDPGNGGPLRHPRVRLGAVPGRRRALVGVALAEGSYYDLPFEVSVSSDGIGGPSAGLAFALGIVDELSGGDLSAGRTVAATGTITPTGQVGEVGGVPEKTLAVQAAGASVFLVPAGDLAAARSEAGPRLEVVPVSSLSQALAALRRLAPR